MSVSLELGLKTGMLCCVLFCTYILPQDTEKYLPNMCGGSMGLFT